MGRAPSAEGEPSHGSDHAAPTNEARGLTDGNVITKPSPLAEKDVPIMIAGADKRKCEGASVGHVRANVKKIFKKPKRTKPDSGGFAFKEKNCEARERSNQFEERAAEDHQRIPETALIRAGENTEDWVSSFVDKEIGEINEEKIGGVNCGVNKENKVGDEPGNAGDAGHGFPFVEVAGEREHEERVATDGRRERQRRDLISRTEGFAAESERAPRESQRKRRTRHGKTRRMRHSSWLG